MKYYFFLLLNLIFSPLWSQSSPDPNFHIYILLGQSNMAGRGEMIEPYTSQQHEKVWMFTAQNQFVTAKHPMHFDKPALVGVGPGLSFGIEMAKQSSAVKIGLVPCAVGGSSINSWVVNGYDEATKTHPLDEAIQRILAAQQQGVIKGILWHQGESDSETSKRVGYIDKLNALIAQIRTITKQANLPFVIGELGYFNQNYKDFNQILSSLNAPAKHTALISAQDLNAKSDNIHFDSQSATELGKRYAFAMQQLP
ncbi:sialate O-acetylesterase [Cytophagaceae bacterium 50C-KIRBA]|uniref:Sialate O-acetylesterase n=1 Tax=Aquirufa beregesia TaxID=2516556 RepID=A0ABX0F3Y9_9BACT|nr:sialate O-acetylesterase [Aquirufa beregesia]NGZ44580.1 sialate O-acetylesterase [Aquirufa beregesia]